MAASRKRVGKHSSEHEARLFKTSDDGGKPSVGYLLSDKFWLYAIAGSLLLFVAVHLNYHRFPGVVQSNDSKFLAHSNYFLEQNAREFLDFVCQYGTRHLGSHANEFIAKQEILERVTNIQHKSKKAHLIEIDVQSPSGCFDLDFIGHFTSCYHNVTNILVRLSPASTKSNSALLVNCHYDTSISSPGASDDLVSCAIMIEVLRVLSQSDIPLRHSIVFNFNGAEEAILQASHGFITQHHWAKDLKAFVNLEAAGAGGREMVFQTGPEHPWLISAYAQAAKYPFASVIGQEIFQSGLIPSDTDYRIYRDFGKIPGIDIAYTYNGYIYHTKYDLPQYIPQGCIQRGGENLLSILSLLANSDKLEDPGDARLGKMVFFDLLGGFMIYYPEKLGEIINIITVVAVLVNLYRKLRRFKQTGRSPFLYLKLVGACYTVHAATFLVMAAVNVLIALIVDTKRPMMWYTNNWLIVPVYILPAIVVWVLIHQHAKDWYSTIFRLVSIWELESIFFEAAMLFWTLLLIVMTGFGLGSAYICMLLVASPLIIRQFIVDLMDVKMRDSPVLYLSLTGLSLILPFLHLMQMVHQLFVFFLPLMGRVGGEVHPDIVVSMLSLLPVVVFSLYQAGFLHVSSSQTVLAFKFIIISATFIFLGCFTGLGFPYSDKGSTPSSQRHILHHFSREFYAFNGSLEKDDHGLLYLPFDYTGARYLQHLPEIAALKEQKLDTEYAYAGWPYYFPMINILKKVFISDMSKPRLESKVKVTSTKEKRSDHVIRYRFVTSGDQVHLNIYLSARDEANVIGWSFTEGTPIPSRMPKNFDRKHYFVYTTSAQHPIPDRKFWVDIKIPEKQAASRHWLDIAFAAHYFDGPDSLMPELANLMSRFPNWTVPIGWSATFQHYKL